MNKTFGQYKKTKSSVAGTAFFIYLCLSAVVVGTCVDFYLKHINPPVMVQIFILFVTITFVLFNYPQILNVVISAVGFFRRKKIYHLYDSVVTTTIENQNCKVAILYVTKDDFITDAFKSTFNQVHKNTDIFVLDDSTDPKIIQTIDDLKNSYKFNIIRRNGVGPKNKAGNINFFLEKYINQYEYIAIMDSDSYIQPNFISDSIKYFDYFGDIGIVQASNNIFVNCQNAFQDMCTPSYSKNRVFGTVDYVAGSEYGVFLCNGHGCVISTKALKSVGGKMPPFISEDWSLSVDMKKQGYNVVFAPNIMTFEEIPPNFVAYKKRILRGQTGAYQFSTTYSGKVIKSNYKLYEKVHILYGAYNSWLTPLYTVFSTVLAFALLYQLQDFTQLPGAAGAISLFFMCLSLMSISCKSVVSKTKFSQTLKTLFGIAMVGSSMLPSMFIKTFMLFFGKKEFKVTIKYNWKFKWYDTFKYNWIDMVGGTLIFAFAFISVGVTGYGQGLINPFLGVTFAGYISLFFTTSMSNKSLSVTRNNDMYKILE